jgi:Ca2+-binding RTX toxin-like protein
MATVEYYTAQRPTQYNDHLTQVVAAGLNEFLAEAVRLGGGSATLKEFIKLTGVFQAPVRSYQISVNGSDVIADGISYGLEQGAEFIATKIALDYVTKALAATGVTSAAVAVGFSAVAFTEAASAVAAALVAHELFSLFGVQDGITNLVNRVLGTEPVWVEAVDKQGDLVRGASYGGGLGGLSEIDAVRGLIQRTQTSGTIGIDNQIGVERASSFSSYTLKAANLAEQIATPLLKTAQDVLGWTGAQDQNGQPKHNSDVFIPHFDQFTIVNDQAKIAIEIPLGSTTEKLALSVRAIATNGDVSGLRELGTVAAFGSAGADSMQVPSPSTNAGSQKVYAFGGGGGDTIGTGAGNDLIFGDNADINSSAANRDGDGADIIRGGAGDDVVYGGGQADQIFGEAGNDKLYGQDGGDQVDGGDGDDQIFGGLGNDELKGGDKTDQIWGGRGEDSIDGGDGDDILNAGSDIMGEDDDSPNTVFGGIGEDQLFGALGNDELGGGDGRDKLVGMAGNDKFFGGRDGDTYTGGAGADEFYVGPQDRVLDSAADDKLFLQYTQVTSTQYMRQFEEFGAFPDHGLRKGYNYYAIGDTDGSQHLLINTGRTLFIFFADGQVAALGNYDQGDFGISVPRPTEFLARANQEFSSTWASLHNSHLNAEPYTKLLAEALRLEAAMTANPDAPLQIPASAKEYVAKILRPDQDGPGYDEATEGVSATAPLHIQNGFSPNGFAAPNDPSGGESLQSNAPGIVVTGTGDSEFLPGTDGADTIAGGAGTDILYGGSGSDSYVYFTDDGFDSIIDFAGAGDVDTLQLADLNPGDVTVTGDGPDLMIHNRSRAAIDNNGAAYTTLFLVGQFEGDGSGVEQIHFADGTIWDRDAITSHAIHAPTGANVVFGGSVEENADAGTFVAQLAGIDPDFDSRFTYSLLDDPSGLFAVTAAGRLNVADGAAIDFERATSHNVIIRVTDQTGLSFDKTLTVAVKNVVGPTITGTDANDTLNGTIEDDVLIGLGGNDSLDGGVGPDRMVGGTGNDTFTVDDPGDIVLENPGEGTDTVKTALAAYTLGDNVENLTGTGTVNQILSGNALDNAISAGAGDDTLVDNAGNDSLNGGTGADKFVFNSVALSGAQSGIFDTIKDYNHGNGAYEPAEGDQIDLWALLATAYNHGSGQAVSALVRAVEDASGTFANLQIDPDGTANGVNWTTIARLDGLQVSNAVNVILDPTLPGGSAVNVIAAPAGSLSINDVSISEGNGGTKVATFTVTRTGGTAAFDVNFATSNGSAAVADSDYVANAGTLHFGVSVNTQTISVTINGDIKVESSETFLVTLSGATNGATLGGSVGTGTITNDDAVKRVLSHDFNADGNSDLLFLNNTSHGVAIWEMNGTQVIASPQVGTLNAAGGWYYQDAGDFNADHKADLLMLNDTTHGVAIWQMDGTQVTANPQIGVINAAGGWHYQDMGDYNGDGKTDLLMLNDTTHGVAIWQMNGTQVTANPQVGVINAAGGWHYQDKGDFNGDHKTDLLMLNDTTHGVAIWQMDGTQVVASPQVGVFE